MKILFLTLLAILFSSAVLGQNDFKAKIKDIDNKEPLAGANAFYRELLLVQARMKMVWSQLKISPMGNILLSTVILAMRT